MYKLRADALNLKDSHVIYGETKSDVIARMFNYLQTNHPSFIGKHTVERLAELDQLMNQHVEEVPD